MPCETCNGPLAFDLENGERFCVEDPSHDTEPPDHPMFDDEWSEW